MRRSTSVGTILAYLSPQVMCDSEQTMYIWLKVWNEYVQNHLQGLSSALLYLINAEARRSFSTTN